MSVHPSLSSKGKGSRSRSVLKRFERLKELQEKEKWSLQDSVFGLPKLKTVRWKVKKAKKAAEAEAPAAEGAAAAPAAGEKKAAPAKEKPRKTTDKK